MLSFVHLGLLCKRWLTCNVWRTLGHRSGTIPRRREAANHKDQIGLRDWPCVHFFFMCATRALLCVRLVLGQGAKVLSGSAQGICPPHRGS